MLACGSVLLRHKHKGCGTQMVENWSHIFKHYTDPECGHTAGALVTRVMLRASGFVGVGEQDDLVCRVAAANLLMQFDQTSRSKRSATHAGLTNVEVFLENEHPRLQHLKTANALIS